jgi:hypothetical protein
MTYAWVITRDYLDGVPVHVCGPRTATDREIKLAGTQGKAFKIYDDDGILYYSGKCWTSEADSDDMFGPLDDYGTPNAGATEIRYRNKDGKFETL